MKFNEIKRSEKQPALNCKIILCQQFHKHFPGAISTTTHISKVLTTAECDKYRKLLLLSRTKHLYSIILSTIQTNLLHHHSHVVKLLLNTSPVDHPWLNKVVELEDYKSISQVTVQMMYERRNAQTVHPVTIHCTLTNIKV